MSTNLTRRSFLTATAITTAAVAAGGFADQSVAGTASPAPAEQPATQPQENQLNIAIIGTGSRGMDHVHEIAKIKNANVIAVCDTDARMLVNAARVYPNAEAHTDFREALQLKKLEAVVIATPDHNHAFITAAALRAGKHVYCEKPLCHTVKEIRAIAALAKETNLVTQMGIQIHAMDNYRRVVEIIKSGVIGPVHEVHIWNNRDGRAAVNSQANPPASLNYDLWQMPLPPRPFIADYHPYNWRAYWSLGEGMLGDIGCHLMDVAFWALDLKYPTRIEVQGPPQNGDIVPDWMIAKYDFPASGSRPALKLTWYDKPKHPDQLQDWKLNENLQKEAVLFIGDEGMLATNYGEHQLLPAEKFKDFQPPPKSIASSPGHQQEWINACLNRDPKQCSAPFAYGALLSETAVLGTVAYRANKPLDWNAENAIFPNAPDANALLDYNYRKGCTL